MSLKLPILTAYKKLIKLCKLLPSKQQHDAVNQIRNEFRQNKNEIDETKIKSLLEKASSSISYLKIITPRTSQTDRKQSGIVTIRFGEDKINKGSKPISNWTGNNLDPDSIARHKNSLNRAGFVNNAHAKGIF